MCQTKRLSYKNDSDKAFTDLKSNNKPFYTIMKPYLTNKGALYTTDINLIENENIIINELEIANIFNDYYTNVVKYSSGISPTNIADKLPPGTKFDDILGEILNGY